MIEDDDIYESVVIFLNFNEKILLQLVCAIYFLLMFGLDLVDCFFCSYR
jgi:hypothetical protein